MGTPEPGVPRQLGDTMKRLQHAALLARREIERGVNPDLLVHIINYPEDYDLRDEEVMGLSSPITWQEWANGGYLLEEYYSLEELAKHAD